MYLTWLLLLVGVIANAPVLIGYFSWMSRVEHYQFYPFAIAAAGGLLYSQRNEFGRILSNNTVGKVSTAISSKPKAWIISTCLAFNAALLVLCSLAGLSLLAWANFLLFLLILVYATYGRKGLWFAFPAIVVMLIMRPLPRSLEDQVTVGMQRLASSLSSHLLDGLGVLHYRTGVVLALAEQSFMAEEACSGIRSLFSSITAIVIWGFFHHYHWLRHIANILQTVVWVLVFNALRIMLVVLVADKTDFDIATGWAHGILGFVIFLLIFGIVLSNDQLISAIFMKPEFEDTPAVSQETAGLKLSWSDWLRWKNGAIQQKIWIGIFACIAVLTIRLEVVNGFASFNSVVSESTMIAPTAEFLPANIADWKLEEFNHLNRKEANELGSDSYRWTFRNQSKVVLLSVDGVFPEHHDLQICYLGMGWQVERTLFYDLLKAQNTENESRNNFTELKMHKLTGESGLVTFSCADRNGKLVPPPDRSIENLGDRMAISIKAILGLQGATYIDERAYQLPISTIQLVYQPSNTMSTKDIEEVQQFFLVVRGLLLKSPRFSAGS